MEITVKLSNNEQRDKELKEKITENFSFFNLDIDELLYLVKSIEEALDDNNYFVMHNEPLFRNEYMRCISKLYPKAFISYDDCAQIVCVTKKQLISLWDRYKREEEKLTNRLNQISKCQASISNLMAVWPEEDADE